MDSVIDFCRTTMVAGMAVGQLALAFACILGGLLVRKILGSVLLRSLLSLTKRTRTSLDDLLVEAIRRPVETGVLLAALALAISVLRLPTEPINIRGFAHNALVLAIAIVAAWLLFRLIDALAQYFGSIAVTTESRLDDALVPLFRKAMKIFVGVVAFVVVVQNLGYSVSGIVAGLGIGGLAIALAAKDTLANIFGSVTILIDRPFRVGDWIRTSEFEGTVEDIGFRSTRVRTFPRTVVVVPNNMLVNTIVDNQQEMPLRRILVTIGVTYDTRAPQMRQLIAEIEGILAATEGIAPDGQRVRFHDFGGSSLDLKIRCFTYALGYDEHSAVRQQLLLTVMEKLEELGLEIAFPSQTVYFGKDEVLPLHRVEPADDSGRPAIPPRGGAPTGDVPQQTEQR